MKPANAKQLKERLERLHAHLEQENPTLAQAVQTFRRLDEAAYRLGILERDESFATQVSWWPVISVLGTFSAGKSTFINRYLGQPLQPTGNQAVDDRFTVICYGKEPEPRTLPGLALDSDPRFPFYQMSREVEHVAAGEGRRIDSYMQLKTCHSERLRGKIIIDSPGFDADAQRTSTLHIVDHIIDLSDLVLVFFDARHPEPGAMRDTLEHLVGGHDARIEGTKFLYVLNQMDAAAREDNPEEVYAAWQRALAQRGLTAGRFYRIYDPDAAFPIADPERQRRFETKREEDTAAIYQRLHQVEVERAYRVAGLLEKTVKRIRDELVPALRETKRRWRRTVLITDAVVFGALAITALVLSIAYPAAAGTTVAWITGSAATLGFTLVAVLTVGLLVHYFVRSSVAKRMQTRLQSSASRGTLERWLARAFPRNARPLKPLGMHKPAGWNRRTEKRLAQVLGEAGALVQDLNDRFTNPSGVHVDPVTLSADRQTAQTAPEPDELREHEQHARHEARRA